MKSNYLIPADEFKEIGLGAVRSETTRLGGDIKISSIPGKGTEFIIRLPLL
jgi:chemotaxis protein histidine kinase CheA